MYSNPLPKIDEQSRPFWDAARAHRLELPKCNTCGQLRTQFERWCPKCGGKTATWTELSGRGKVWSHCTFHRKYFEQFSAEIPYQVVLVQLEEGPKLITNMVDGVHAEIDMPVLVQFVDVTPDVTLIKFRTAAR